MFICHLYIFFGDVSAKELDLFFDFFFLLLNFRCLLYILDNCFYQMCLLQIVSPGLWLILSFFIVSFAEQKFFNFSEFQLLNNLLSALCLWYCIYLFLSRMFDVLFHKVFTESQVYHTVRSRNPIHWIILGNS